MKNPYKHTPEPSAHPQQESIRKEGNRVRNAVQDIPAEEPEITQEPEEKKSPKASLADMNFVLNRQNMHIWMPWVLSIFAIGMFYIANSNKAQKTVRRIDDLNAELKELRSEYMTIKSDLEYRSNLSQLSTRLEPEGLKPLQEPPRKIVVSPPKK